MDERHENFKRIAQKRTNKIIQMIELLGNLNNRSFYDFTDEEISNVFDAIQDELNLQRKSFIKDKNKIKFKL